MTKRCVFNPHLGCDPRRVYNLTCYKSGCMFPAYERLRQRLRASSKTSSCCTVGDFAPADTICVACILVRIIALGGVWCCGHCLCRGAWLDFFFFSLVFLFAPSDTACRGVLSFLYSLYPRLCPCASSRNAYLRWLLLRLRRDRLFLFFL